MSKYEHKSAKDKAFEKERIQFRHRIHDLEAENKQLRQTIGKQTDAIETLNDQLRVKEEWIERLLMTRIKIRNRSAICSNNGAMTVSPPCSTLTTIHRNVFTNTLPIILRPCFPTANRSDAEFPSFSRHT